MTCHGLDKYVALCKTGCDKKRLHRNAVFTFFPLYLLKSFVEVYIVYYPIQPLKKLSDFD